MKGFQFTEEGRNFYVDLLEAHKHYILTNMTPIDSDVENQKSRFTKLLCWVFYGHLKDTDKAGNCSCKRCGKSMKC